jgi:hypothetical protein
MLRRPEPYAVSLRVRSHSVLARMREHPEKSWFPDNQASSRAWRRPDGPW